ncbi:MAG: arylsulfatase A-like enzyme, partial [Myxococcota bacterium]
PAATAPVHLADRVGGARVDVAPLGPPLRPQVWSLATSDGWTVQGAGDSAHTADGVSLEVLTAASITRSLPNLAPSDWGAVEVELDATGGLRDLEVSLGATPATAVVVADGRTHRVRLHLDGVDSAPWTQLGLSLSGAGPGTALVRSVTLLPRGRAYADAPAGVVTARRGKARLQAIHLHTPGTVAIDLRVPADARLDLALGLAEDPDPVTFGITLVDPEGRTHTLLEQAWADANAWSQQHVDLSAWAGQTVTLRLQASSAVPGAVALWGSPVVSSRATSPQPNVIVYAIDGAGADYMSLYDYDRPTTPVLAALAAEGTVFERAHTTSGWTKSSTASFMTSLHHSVLGGYRSDSDRIPDTVDTLAERFRAAGYQTGVFTSNPFAGSLSGLEAGVDLFRDAHVAHNSASSVSLHEAFLAWRDDWPAEPYWAHIQPTDVHEPHAPVPPFAGTFASPERRAEFDRWWATVHTVDGPDKDTVLGRYLDRLERMGVDPRTFFETQRDLYDETMLHADHQIGELVAELKARGEWERTVLVVTADHGHPAGSFSRFGRGLLVPQPADWEGAIADSYRSHVPLLVVWPGHVRAGERVSERVSLIDLAPTLVDFAGLPPATLRQGQSWRPLLTGEGEWEDRPIVLDQFQGHTASGELVGHLEMIDGRWAASLEVMPASLESDYRAAGESLRTAGGWRAARPHRPSTPSLLLYDYDADPLCTTNVNAAHPELVAEFTERLEQQWQAHRLLADQFAAAGEPVLTDEQLEGLRLLGYVE